MCLWDMKKEKVILGSRYLQIASDSALSLPVTFLDIVTASTFYDILCNPLQCSCLENPRTGEPGGLSSVGLHRVGHD